jgi:hypothetical protein
MKKRSVIETTRVFEGRVFRYRLAFSLRGRGPSSPVGSGGFDSFLCLKSLNRFVPSIEVGNRVGQGQALLLTHCSPRTKRITRDPSVRRNELVVELAKALLILSAPEGSASLNLARSALRQGKTVHTLEHRLNKDLLIAGAVPATLDTIKEALR